MYNYFSDVSNQADLLLTNLKEIIENLQTQNVYFQGQVENLQVENKNLTVSNINLTNKVKLLEEKFQSQIFW